MADKSVLKALYEVKKRKDNQVTLDIFKEVKKGSDGVIFVLNDDLVVAIAKGHTIKVVGADIEITEEEGGGSDPQKQKIFAEDERKAELKRQMSKNWEFLNNRDDVEMGTEEKNPYEENDLSI